MKEIRHGQRPERDHFVSGLVLVAIGLVALIGQVWQPREDVGGWVLLLIGIGFLAAYVYTRQYGYLVPGGIFTGLGAGVIVSQVVAWPTAEAEGAPVVLGLGLGFLGIWLIGELARVDRNRWWPLIPGSILGFVGVALLIGGDAIRALDYWGVILVGIGLVVIWRAWLERRPTQTLQ